MKKRNSGPAAALNAKGLPRQRAPKSPDAVRIIVTLANEAQRDQLHADAQKAGLSLSAYVRWRMGLP